MNHWCTGVSSGKSRQMRLSSDLSFMFATAKEKSWSWNSISTTHRCRDTRIQNWPLGGLKYRLMRPRTTNLFTNFGVRTSKLLQRFKNVRVFEFPAVRLHFVYSPPALVELQKSQREDSMWSGLHDPHCSVSLKPVENARKIGWYIPSHFQSNSLCFVQVKTSFLLFDDYCITHFRMWLTEKNIWYATVSELNLHSDLALRIGYRKRPPKQ